VIAFHVLKSDGWQVAWASRSPRNDWTNKHSCVCWLYPTSPHTQERDRGGVVHVSQAQYLRCATRARGTFPAPKRGLFWSFVGEWSPGFAIQARGLSRGSDRTCRLRSALGRLCGWFGRDTGMPLPWCPRWRRPRAARFLPRQLASSPAWERVRCTRSGGGNTPWAPPRARVRTLLRRVALRG
jgi:hypothetical protein